MIELISQLDENTEELMALANRIPKEILNLKPATGGWSIIQILDHLVTTEIGILGLMRSEGSIADAHRENKLERIQNVALNREEKYKAPQPLEPKGKTDNLEKFINIFPSIRDKMKMSINSKDLEKECDIFPHFVLGYLTYKEWIFFTMSHIKRHMAQIEEVLAGLDS